MKRSQEPSSSGSRRPAPAPESPPETVRDQLMAALGRAGLEGAAATAFADSALVLGALTQGRPVGTLELGHLGDSAREADERGGRPGADAAPGSMEAHLRTADVALTAVEAIADCQTRLDAALVAAAAQQTTAVGAALLRQRDVADPDELSRTARERWRAQAKSRTRAEIAPAIGWTAGETAHLVGLATAPVAFSTPVVTQMVQGRLPWRLAKALWRACQGMDAADASHVAHVMCGDEQETCVPERLTPEGEVTTAPWEHRAFWGALDREVAKIVHADDGDPQDAAADRAAREAAHAGRRVFAKAGDDGMGSLTLLMPIFWVAAIKDRLRAAAVAARGAGDERTLDQLEADVGRALLAHASLGLADLPVPQVADGEQVTADDLARAGWSQELIQALSGLPPAVLQVVVPLIGLHDPAAAEPLPSVGRAAVVQDPNHLPHPGGPDHPGPGPDQPGPDPGHPGHTGRDGCPACLPGRRSQGPPGHSTPPEACPAPKRSRGRRLWVGELLGAFPSFVSPSQVRQLALAPGTTMARLLVDAADGRCVERSRESYRWDAAMRSQILAADVTCRAPGCHHHGGGCQIDHVTEHGTPGGNTTEANAQLLHTGHHEPKTAKHWDASLAANRDVTWTSLLGRIYSTRVWDYRRYVTLLTDAVDKVAAAPPEDHLDTLNREVYLALTYRYQGDRLNVGDDDLDPDIWRFAGWPLVGLTHRDPATGQRVPGPRPEALDETAARLAAASLGGPDGAEHPDGAVDAGETGDQAGGSPEPRSAAAPDPDKVRLSPPPGVCPEDWTRRIRARLARGEDVPPF